MKQKETTTSSWGDSPVLLVFTNQATSSQLRQSLLSLGFRHVTLVTNHYQGLKRLRERNFPFVFFEATASNLNAIEFVKSAKNLTDRTLLIAASNSPRVDDVFGLLKEGARHYLVLPFSVDSVDQVLQNAENGPPFSEAVLQASDRNSALANVAINSLEKFANVTREARKFISSSSALVKYRKQFQEATELAILFHQGELEDLKRRIVDAFITRATQPSTQVGRTRQKLKKQREENKQHEG